MGKFLRNINKEKQFVGELYSKVNRNIPKADVGSLVRDFRIDEEEGMRPDATLQPSDIHHDKI